MHFSCVVSPPWHTVCFCATTDSECLLFHIVLLAVKPSGDFACLSSFFKVFIFFFYFWTYQGCFPGVNSQHDELLFVLLLRHVKLLLLEMHLFLSDHLIQCDIYLCCFWLNCTWSFQSFFCKILINLTRSLAAEYYRPYCCFLFPGENWQFIDFSHLCLLSHTCFVFVIFWYIRMFFTLIPHISLVL